MSWRELATVVGIYFVLAFAVQLADGDARHVVNRIALLFIPTTIGFFVARALWRRWRAQSYGTSARGVGLALAIALVSWANVGMATAVRGINENNYALILIGPLAMFVALLISLGGVFAAGLGIASAVTASRSVDPGRGWTVLGGLAAAALNLAPILLVYRIFERG